jgi:hypothetical protein
MRAVAERLHLPLVPDQRRSKNNGAIKALTLRGTAGVDVDYPTGAGIPTRPRTRGECYRLRRPCPFVSCRHHLGIDLVRRTSSRLERVRVNYPDWDPTRPSCSLDIADVGALSLEYVALLMNLTRESVRLIELSARRKLQAGIKAKGDDSHVASEDD